MSDHNFLPYLTYYPEFHSHLIKLLVIFNLFYHHGLIPQIPFPVPIKGDYDHTGISGYLQDCIELHNKTLDLQQKLNRFQTIYESEVEIQWMALEKEYLFLGFFLERLKSKLEILKETHEMSHYPGWTAPKDYELRKWFVRFEDMPRAAEWIRKLIKMRDELYGKMLHPFPGFSILNLTTMINESDANRVHVSSAVSFLRTRGIYLSSQPDFDEDGGLTYWEPSDPDAFDIEHLLELRGLFTGLDAVFQSNGADKGWSNAIMRNFRLPEPNGLRQFSNMPTFEKIEAFRLKYETIPSSYVKHSQSLHQFAEWEVDACYKIRKMTKQLIDKFHWITNSFSGFISRIDKSLAVSVQTLYNDFRMNM